MYRFHYGVVSRSTTTRKKEVSKVCCYNPCLFVTAGVEKEPALLQYEQFVHKIKTTTKIKQLRNNAGSHDRELQTEGKKKRGLSEQFHTEPARSLCAHKLVR
jgi:hypothetical protein